METHNSNDLPTIEVLVAKGEHDLSIRVSDQVSHVNTRNTFTVRRSKPSLNRKFCIRIGGGRYRDFFTYRKILAGF